MARVEIFCRVIDNFGDIGVCWRLARQLVVEQGASVRLWLDHLETLAPMAKGVQGDSDRQWIAEVEVCRWASAFQGGDPDWPDIVIEGFGCGVPEAHAVRLARRAHPPRWIILEYLSAEAWVDDHHAMPSPHPKWGTPRHFFFPGFGERSGGLLREHDLLARRDAFGAAACRQYWQSRGIDDSPPETFSVSVFAYPGAPVKALLDRLQAPQGLPAGRSHSLAAFAPGELADRMLEGTRALTRGGRLTVCRLPFVAQPEFDEMLWASDFNIVRGEDSFVRAQWAARPFVWHIYPQADDAHQVKLDAFLDRYCGAMSPVLAAAVRALWTGFNRRPDGCLDAWPQVVTHWHEWQRHARAWSGQLARQTDLASRLAAFCRDPL